MVETRIEKIDLKKTNLLREFINSCGNSKDSFRYFNTRPLDIISNHVLTILAFNDSVPVGYGHLDKEGDKIWFGIAVAENYKGKGIGKKVMQYLIEYADNNKILELHLSVDSDNVIAVNMYNKFNFFEVKNLSLGTVLMKRKNNNEI